MSWVNYDLDNCILSTKIHPAASLECGIHLRCLACTTLLCCDVWLNICSLFPVEAGMHFSGRVRAGEVMPLDRGLLTAGKGKSVEAIVDGVSGKGFAFPWSSLLWKFKTVFCGLGRHFKRSSKFCGPNVWLHSSLCPDQTGEQTHPHFGCSLGI